MTLSVENRPSPNFSDRREGCEIDILLLHYTGMESCQAASDWLCNPRSEVSCHYLVDLDGTVTAMVPEDKRAWHAGLSYWAGSRDVNSRSIGIEIHNPGHAGGYPDYTDAQMRAVIALSADILSRHAIAPRHVLAHSDVSPERKEDPGEKFDWRRLHENGIGLWVEPAPISEGRTLRTGDQGALVRALQEKLVRYGYGLEVSGWFDERTGAVVRAFQRHFRQARVDGIADPSTVETLDRLIAALGDEAADARG